MTDQQIVDNFLKELVELITQKYAPYIDFIILFGSAARGEFKRGISDIDLVIQLKTDKNTKEIEEFATDTFWRLDKKHNTEFEKVASTTKAKSILDYVFKQLEKQTHLYVPIFVFPPGWIIWEKGYIERPIWKPAAIIIIHQTFIFQRFKEEGKILFGRDIRPLIKPNITFWERWKAIQVPFWLSLFSILILPFASDKSVKYSTKAILYELDSALGYLKRNIKGKEKNEKIETLRQSTKINLELKFFNLQFNKKLRIIPDKEFTVFTEALKVKTKEVNLMGSQKYTYVFRLFWAILRINWSIILKVQ